MDYIIIDNHKTIKRDSLSFKLPFPYVANYILMIDMRDCTKELWKTYYPNVDFDLLKENLTQL